MQTEITHTRKIPFQIDAALSAIRKGVRPLPKATLFQLADEGWDNVFHQIVACMISVRTLDEISLECARSLFSCAPTPEKIVRLGVSGIDRLIRPSTFHEQKAPRIHRIAEIALEKYHGTLPCDERVLLDLPGIGPKCANLALGIACGQPRVGVDVHVHRVTRRWGYITAPTPEKAVHELEAKLPRKYWVEINALLVPFGKAICRGPLPRCSTCPVLSMCRQVGVGRFV